MKKRSRSERWHDERRGAEPAMKRKSLLLLCGILIVVGAPAYEVGLEGIKSACLRVERVDAGYGVTDRDIDAYAMAWLKARVFKREPDAQINASASIAFMGIFGLHVIQGFLASQVPASLVPRTDPRHCCAGALADDCVAPAAL